MEHTYQLIKLKTRTVQDLKKLRIQVGKQSINDLINLMIRVTDSYYIDLKNYGWDLYRKK